MSEELEQSNKIPSLKNKLVLLILDGWGVAPCFDYNAICAAQTKNINTLMSMYPSVVLRATSDKNTKTIYQDLGYNYEFTSDSQEKKNLTTIFTQKNIRQLLISTPQSYINTTYYFNGFTKEPLHNQKWELITDEITDHPENTPKLYVQKVFDRIIKALDANDSDIIIASLPSIEWMASFGSQESATKNLEYIDKYINKLSKTALSHDTILCITSTTGNAEEMVHKNTELVNKNKTANAVPFIVCKKELEGMSIQANQTILENDMSLLQPIGSIKDIPVTLLTLLNIKTPEGMNGNDLLAL